MIPTIKTLKETAFAEVAFLVHGDDLREMTDFYLPHIQPVIRRFQRIYREKMANIRDIDEHIARICSRRHDNSLAPSKSTVITTEDWDFFFILQPGHHIAVYCSDKKIYHHGIYLGFHEPADKRIIHCNRSFPSSIEYCSVETFFGLACQEYYLVHHPEYHTPGHNEQTVCVARLLTQLPSQHTLQHYSLLKWNSECFAWACVTRFECTHSEQVQKLWLHMNSKLGPDIRSTFSMAWCSLM